MAYFINYVPFMFRFKFKFRVKYKFNTLKLTVIISINNFLLCVPFNSIYYQKNYNIRFWVKCLPEVIIRITQLFPITIPIYTDSLAVPHVLPYSVIDDTSKRTIKVTSSHACKIFSFAPVNGRNTTK
jgi:hypothetical protein